MAGRWPAGVLAALVLASMGAWADSDLSITQEVTPTPMSFGENATITIEVSNAGPDAASDVQVVQTVPGGATILSASDGGVIDDLQVGWSIDLIDSGETVVLQVEIIAGLNSDSAMTQVIMAARDAGSDQGGLFLVDPSTGTASSIVSFTMAGELTDAGGDGPTYVTDMGQEAVTEFGEPMLDGQIFDDMGAVISSGELLVNPAGVVVRGTQLFVADRNGIRLDEAMNVSEDTSGRILIIDPTTGAQEILAEGDQLFAPQAIAFEPDGQLVVADGAGRLVRVDPDTGVQTLLFSGGRIQDPVGLAAAPDGTFYLLDRVTGLIEVGGSVGQSVLAAIGSIPEFATPGGLSRSLTGRLYVSVNAAPGFVLEFDPETEQFVGTTSGIDNDFARPAGSTTIDQVTTDATVSFAGMDPDTSNNSFILGTQIVFAATPAMVTISITEQISVADTPTVTVPVLVAVTETISVADTVNTTPVVLVDVQETIRVTDTNGTSAATLISVRELVSVADAAQPQVPDRPPTVPGVLPMERFCEGENFVLSDTPITRIEVAFDQPMRVGEGDGAVDDVSSYRLASDSSCTGAGDGLIGEATWNGERQVVDLVLEDGAALAAGDYLFRVCDRVRAEAGVALDGNGDGVSGGDYRKAFRVIGDNRLENPNFDRDLRGWEAPGEVGSGDALGVATSRSIGLESGDSLSQCVALETGERFVRTSLATQSEGANRFEVRFDFATAENCQGEVVPQPTTLLSPGGAAWRRLFVDSPIPEGARSVRLVITPDGPARFDALSLYTADAAFESSFEGGECGFNFVPTTELPDAGLTEG
ncbi:MAG: hypothetical protein AAGE01_14865 [Pseudomonadota bacterium]